MQHNPITLRRRQEIISAFSTNTCAMSRRQALRIRKISTKGYLLALNSENQINRKCIEDSKEYNYWDVKSDRVNVPVCSRHSWSRSLPTIRVNEGKMYCASLDYEIISKKIFAHSMASRFMSTSSPVISGIFFFLFLRLFEWQGISWRL